MGGRSGTLVRVVVFVSAGITLAACNRKGAVSEGKGEQQAAGQSSVLGDIPRAALLPSPTFSGR